LSRIFSSATGGRLNWPQIYLGVAFTTLATLILELSLTRLFSVVFYYHFAFLAISIALFGLGAGGVLSYLFATPGRAVYRRLGFLACGISVAALLGLVVVLTRTDASWWTLALVYFTSALPFVFAGIVVSLAISETIERVHRVYFYDLMGAAGGCLLLVPFLNFFGGPNTIIAAAVLFAVSASIWFNLGGSSRGRAFGVALALALVALLVFNMRPHPPIDVQFAKGQKIANEVFVKWNSFSRVAVAPEPASKRLQIVIDADASTGIASFDFENLSVDEKQWLLHQGPGFPYQVRPGAKTLIIGPGGGWDVSRAIASGSKDITGVEINPIIATTIMRERFADYSRRLYFRPEVRIVVEDGRSFARRTPEKYQVIQATLVDTWASTAAGAFALSENNLYTTDAFHDYLSHLTDDGILAFSRWGFDPPRESLRLLALAKVALDRLGEHDHQRHFIVVREGQTSGWGALDTVLISRKPFRPEDLARAHSEITLAKMQPVYLPDSQLPNSRRATLLTSMLVTGTMCRPLTTTSRSSSTPCNRATSPRFWPVQKKARTTR
jgi:MFS family permease